MKKKRAGRGAGGKDAHIKLDPALWAEVEATARAEDRSATATIRVLVREALAARNQPQGKGKA